MDALKFVQLLFTGLELLVGLGFLIKAFKFMLESNKIKAHKNSTYYLYWLGIVILLLHTFAELGEISFNSVSSSYHFFFQYLTNILYIAFFLLMQMFCYKLIICYKQNNEQSIQSINKYQAKLSKVEKVLW